MSLEASRWAWRVCDVTSSEKLTLLAYADHADQKNVAWPSIALLQKLTKLSPRTIKRCTAQLRDRGLLIGVGFDGRTGKIPRFLLTGRVTKRGDLELWISGGWKVQIEANGATVSSNGATVTNKWGHGGPQNLPRNRIEPKRGAAAFSGKAAPPETFSNLKRSLQLCGE